MSVPSNRFHFCLLLIHVLLHCAVSCTVMYTNRPLNGFYCDNGFLNNITDIAQQQCTRRCLIHQACRVMSYNRKDRVCILGATPCDVAMNHPNYMLMVFRADPTKECVVWKRNSSPLPNRAVETRLTARKALGRKQIGSDIFIGHGSPNNYAFFIVNGIGQQHMEWFVLTVNPTCTMAWVPHTAESTLPKNALECGHISDVGPTYCARIWRPDLVRMFFGYYHTGHKVAYYAYHGAQRSTELDILFRV